MTVYLLDTSVLVRLVDTAAANHLVAARAVGLLGSRGDALHIAPQNLVEFRNAATRPKGVNGLGMSAAVAEGHEARFEADFALLPDIPTIHPAWKAIVRSLGVVGKQVHDARLVAVCHAHAVTHVLTFNTGHFARLAAAPPGVAVVDPASV